MLSLPCLTLCVRNCVPTQAQIRAKYPQAVFVELQPSSRWFDSSKLAHMYSTRKAARLKAVGALKERGQAP